MSSNNERMLEATQIVDKAKPLVPGEVLFHMLPEQCFALKSALGSIVLDNRVVAKLIDEWAKGVVTSRLEDLGSDVYIRQQFERRIEVATKNAFGRIEADLLRIATEMIRKKLSEVVASMPLEVTCQGASNDVPRTV